MTTLADVARVAGVSTMTVSNVLAGRSHKVSVSTAQRVRDAVDATGYVPSRAARSLSARSSRIIALVINGDGAMMTSTHDARYVGELARELQERGFSAMLVTATDLRGTAANMKSWNVDGAIFINTVALDLEELRDVHDVPMLFSDNYSDDPTILTVRSGDAAGGVLAARHLLSHGHRRAVFAGPIRNSVSVDDERWRGFRIPFAEAGLSEPQACQGVVRTDVAGGMELARRWVENGEVPPAVLCSADDLAAGLTIGLTSAGVDVPGDISIIGYDGFDIGRVTSPPLTTIAQDICAKARLSVESLLRAIDPPAASHDDLQPDLPLSLIRRSSVAVVGSPVTRDSSSNASPAPRQMRGVELT